MKLACTSTAFDRAFSAGETTQIEWIETCAREFEADGVVLDVRHFPRTDSDYLAQIKKFATDLGTCIVALYDDGAFMRDETGFAEELEIARAIGAPIVAGRLPQETECSWVQLMANLNAATTLAKTCNITLAVRNAEGTFASGTSGLKRVGKEPDSAWLRYALDLDALDTASDPEKSIEQSVLIWPRRPYDNSAVGENIAVLDEYRGFVVLDGTGDPSQTKSALRTWRTALFAPAEPATDRT